jgi:hypothetical protein
MSTDRELLEAAARSFWAGEIDDVVSIEWGDMDACILYTHADNQDHNGRDRQYRWNPLEENHDAFELAVKLRAVVGPHVISIYLPAPDYWLSERVDQSGDPCTNIRRAIVRAAASMASQEKAE